jgi:hypothetical protein
MIDEGRLSATDVSISIAGNISPYLIREISRLKISKSISYLGLIDRIDLIDSLPNYDYLWVIVANLKSHYLGIPLKTYEYIASGSQLLVCAPALSESSNLIQELNCGFVLENKEDFESALDNSVILENAFMKRFDRKVIDFEKAQKYLVSYQISQFESIMNGLSS